MSWADVGVVGNWHKSCIPPPCHFIASLPPLVHSGPQFSNALRKKFVDTFLCQFRCKNIVVTMMKFSIAFSTNIRHLATHSCSVQFSSVESSSNRLILFAFLVFQYGGRHLFLFDLKSACEINFNR